jgi:acid phosphatase (class A)
MRFAAGNRNFHLERGSPGLYESVQPDRDLFKCKRSILPLFLFCSGESFMQLRSFLALVIAPALVLVLASSPAWAFDSSQGANQIYVQPQFLPPQLLSPPPDEGSAAWKVQADQVVKAQRKLAPSDIAAMRDEQHVSLALMTPVMGPVFTRDNLPKTFAMLDHVLASAEQISTADKKFWHTRRPYRADSRVKIYIDRIDDSPSYPSGHTTDSRVLAEILGLLDPSKLPGLRARADAIARHRIEAGVHYPCDIEAGRTLAMLVVGAIVANDDFQDDLALARKELTAKTGLTPAP